MSFIPLYERIKERIREDLLAAHDPRADKRLPTERELQARYQVSRPTISKALAALAAEGIIYKAQGRGSFALLPEDPQEGQETSPPRRIGYVGRMSGAPLVQRAFRGIDRVAHRHDYIVLVGGAGDNVAREHAIALELIASGAAGLIIYPVPRIGAEWEQDYLQTETFSVPVVLIDTACPEQGHAQVIFDNRRLGREMTAWLLREGHRRIALLTCDAAMRHAPLEARLRGYQEALKDHGVERDPALIRRYAPLDDTVQIATILNALLALPEPPTAIIAPEDMAALELIELLQARGVRVPDEVCVAGFDNQEAARRFRPAFPTSNPDFERMGELACEILLDSICAGESPAHAHLLEVPLLIRRERTPTGAGRELVRT